MAERHAVQEIHSLITSEIGRFRQLAEMYDRLKGAYDEQRGTGGGVRLLDTLGVANAAIGQAMAKLSTTRGLYTAQPTARSAEILEASRQRDGGMLRRGISMYTIYPASARSREPESQWAEEMSALGAQIRTSPTPFPRIIIVDGVAAFLEEPNSAASGEPGPAIEFTHPSAVAWVKSIFMYFWQLSQRWHGERTQPVSGTLTTPRERVILRLLENEESRAAIARHLTVSQRTVTGELASLREKFGVETDFALALRWRDHPEYSLP